MKERIRTIEHIVDAQIRRWDFVRKERKYFYTDISDSYQYDWMVNNVSLPV